MNTTIQIRSKGNITLPSGFRRKYGLGEGEVLTMIDLGKGSCLLTPKVTQVDRYGDRVAKVLKEANVSLEDLLTALDEERKQFYKEHYARE